MSPATPGRHSAARPYYGGGYCRRHDWHNRHYGDPLAGRWLVKET